jgi:endonuclease YncB( thermonuclease family)
MKLHYQILLPLLSLFWVRVDLTDLFPLTLPVHIVEIRDGDTLTARSGNKMLRVRFSRIDAPELHQRFHQSKVDAGYFSRDCVRNLAVADTTLTIEGFDLYHRILGDVGGLNYLAIKNGCAGLYPHTRFSSVNEKMMYLKALNEAKKNRRGVWGHGGYLIPKKFRKISKRDGHQQWHRSLHSRGTYRPGRRSG